WGGGAARHDRLGPGGRGHARDAVDGGRRAHGRLRAGGALLVARGVGVLHGQRVGAATGAAGGGRLRPALRGLRLGGPRPRAPAGWFRASHLAAFTRGYRAHPLPADASLRGYGALPALGPRPAVSVVVPFAGSVEEARSTLDALGQLALGPGDELIVVDNTGA